jgi:hypothetical protein
VTTRRAIIPTTVVTVVLATTGLAVTTRWAIIPTTVVTVVLATAGLPIMTGRTLSTTVTA